MNEESLKKIKKIFKSLNDKLAKLEDPALYGRKRTEKYREVDNKIDDVRSSDNQVNKRLNDINEKLDEHDDQLKEQAIKIDELESAASHNETEVQPLLPTEVPAEEIAPKIDEQVDKKTEQEPVHPVEQEPVKPVAEPVQSVDLKTDYNSINERLDDLENITRDLEDKIINLENADTPEPANDDAKKVNKSEKSTKKPDAVKENPLGASEEELKAAKVRYDTKTQRFHELEGDRENLMIGKKDVQKRLEENAAKESPDADIFSQIHDNLVEINKSFDNIFKMLTADTAPSPSSDAKSENKPEAKDTAKKGALAKFLDFVGNIFDVFTGVQRIIALAIIGVYPVILGLVNNYVKPLITKALDFVMEDLPKFFTETLPKFFMETLPKLFEEKVDAISDMASDFAITIQTVVANIKKSIGQTMMDLADKITLPGAGALKDTIKTFGKGLVDDADKDLSDLDKKKLESEQKKKEKEKNKDLEKMAEARAEEFLKNNKEYDGYDVKVDTAKNTVTINYTPKDALINDPKQQTFDAEQSKSKGSLVPASNSKPKPNEGASKPSTDATPKPADATPKPVAPEGSSGATTALATSEPTPSASGSSGGGASGSSGGGASGSSGGGATGASAATAVPSTGATGAAGATAVPSTGATGASAATAVPSTGATGAAGATAVPSTGATGAAGATAAPTDAPSPVSPVPAAGAAAGDNITSQSLGATAPIPKNNGGVNVIGSGGSTSRAIMVKGRPHSIDDVPDPTPDMGSIADQLFYRET